MRCRRNFESDENLVVLLGLHGLCWKLGREDTETLLDGDTVSGELVIGGEASRVCRLGQDAFDGFLLERVDTLAVLLSRSRIIGAAW